ncbi:four-carbon acid sugar kinase family protein [Lentibacillus sediminis]|uniref:four-carbon acid sugar kinase family protein n=1 Tax=Lentibacillus sediminis TaxID=1940529 RepID=UPI000C1C16A1|nr:four-carbon acid sugar kinase family protein [Lentibacillus sediminis]
MEQCIGIIADDLTGANDSGVQLIEKGINTSVLFDIPNSQKNLDSGIVIDTNSRALTQEEAALITEKAGRFLKEAGYSYVYKKMDSTLRGHIGTELQALYHVFKPEFVFIAPAFPQVGRTTRDGVHFVNGVEIAKTEISQDPNHPVTESFIPAMLEKEIGQPVGLLKKEDIEADLPGFKRKINEFKGNNINYIVCDAEVQEDLQKAAQKMAAVTKDVIWAGSAGLALEVPEVLVITQDKVERAFPASGQVMTVCGSLSEITQNQVGFAIGQPNVKAVELDTMKVFGNDWKMYSQDVIANVLEGFDEGKDVVLYVPSNREIREKVKHVGEKLSLTSYEIGKRISDAIGEAVAEISAKNKELTGLVLTGGDTAKAASYHLGGIGFSLIKQVEAGIPLGALIGSDVEYTVVTKAGAFGKENSIYQAMQELKGVQK